MSRDKNPFGGGNPLSLYTPMTDTEREVIQRLIDNNQFFIHVVGWGNVNRIETISCGDATLRMTFYMTFLKPEEPVPVNYLDLQLKARCLPKMVLFQKRYAFMQEVLIGAGLEIGLGWDIQIRKMSEKSVKAIKTAARGLTTREGNWNLQGREAALLRTLRRQEEKVRQFDRQEVARATAKTQGQIKQGIIVPSGRDS